MKTVFELSTNETKTILSYELRTTGDKPAVEAEFFEVGSSGHVLKCVPK